jgi:hypothetical protein
MPVNVLYEGVLVAESADPKGLPSGLFLAMAGPMPVGTRLAVVAGDERRDVRVKHVLEAGGEIGVVVVGAQGERLTVEQLFSASGNGAAGPAPDEASGDGAGEESVIELEAESDDERPTNLELPIVDPNDPASIERAAAAAAASNGVGKGGEGDGRKGGKRRRGKRGR